MSLLETLILLAIAGLIGALAEFLIGFSLGGMLGAMIVGVVGALIGSWLARLLHLPAILPIQVGTRTIELVWATLGSILLVGLLSALRVTRARITGARPACTETWTVDMKKMLDEQPALRYSEHEPDIAAR